jgi:hypothetical protein
MPIENVVYLDFDGTLTDIEGKLAMKSLLCKALEGDGGNTPDKRARRKEMYDRSEQGKITEKAKQFLTEVNALHPHVAIVIISNNHENYIRALLEYEGISAENITIYSKESKLFDKRAGVLNYETNCLAGYRLICDDDADDVNSMWVGLRESGKENIVDHHCKEPCQFEWDVYLNKVKEFAEQTKIKIEARENNPVPEYLNGNVSSRFHLFSAKMTPSPALTSVFNDIDYSAYRGDQLKRVILCRLKEALSDVTNSEELERIKNEFLSSQEYNVLRTGQGLATRLFHLKTDSQKAVETIFKNAKENLASAPPSNDSSPNL